MKITDFLIIFILVTAITFFILIMIGTYKNYELGKKELDFCVNNNYTHYFGGSFFEQQHYCSNIVNGTIIKYYIGDDI